MRLANGIVIDKEATFGALKFSALRREVRIQNENQGTHLRFEVQRTGADDSSVHPCQRAAERV